MTKHRLLHAVATAALLAALPLAGNAQTTQTGTQAATAFSQALAHVDRETQMLAGMTNHIPSRNVFPVSVDGLALDAPARRALSRLSPARRSALQSALGKVQVADVDRLNGQSEDQSTLAEYLQHLGVDPARVVAVDIDSSQDRQNPRVTVFYRGHLRTAG